VEATVDIGERIQDSRVEATIDMASVDSGDVTRDDHLRSDDFFDVMAWPTATFRSTAIVVDGAAGTMTGDLTIKGVTRPVTLQVEYLGAVRDPWGNDRAIFEAHGRINREAWGLTWNMALEAGGLLVSKDITLEFQLELVRAA
jgi:polyisoprenoid-binding protein YceI